MELTKTMKTMLMAIEENGSMTATDIQRTRGISYACIVNGLKVLKNMGLIASKREGKFISYTLTDKGKEVCDCFKKIEEVIKNGQN